MPTPYPKEFRHDVIAVARQGDQSIAQVARSFGTSDSCLAPLAEDRRPRGRPRRRTARLGSRGFAELRELRKRTKQLEQDNEILRRAAAYFTRDVLPLRSSSEPKRRHD